MEMSCANVTGIYLMINKAKTYFRIFEKFEFLFCDVFFNFLFKKVFIF